ncbi:hypothetical protein FBU59_002326, partial [Linderina macrospora]
MSKSNISVAIEEGEIIIPQSGPERDVITKRLLRKLDMRLVTYMSLLYLFNTLDRGNIGNARLGGLEKDTHLTGNDFYNVLSFFYFGYCISQVPNMFLLKK